MHYLFDKYAPTLQHFLSGLGVDTQKITSTDLLLTAFVHKSFAYDQKESIESNERLEFLGDSLLGAVINIFLYKDFPSDPESILTLYKVALVREENLAEVARDIGLDKVVLLSNGEEKSGGRNKDVILADCLEALLAYLFLDMGRNEVEKFIRKYIYVKLTMLREKNVKSYKSLLQELVQGKYKITPVYVDTDHEVDDKGNVLIYKSEVVLGDIGTACGFGSNKKSAQEKAAESLYNTLIS